MALTVFLCDRMKRSLTAPDGSARVFTERKAYRQISDKMCRAPDVPLIKQPASSARMRQFSRGCCRVQCYYRIWPSGVRKPLRWLWLLFMAWRHNVRNKSAYLYWGLGFLFSGIGFAMVAVARRKSPTFFPSRSAMPSRLLGQSALGRRLSWRSTASKLEWWALLPPVIWLAGVFLPWINDDYSNRVILYNLASATGATALAMAVAAGRSPRNEGHAHHAGGHLCTPGLPLLRRGAGNGAYPALG